ncbi:MAG TPA: sigma-70 family RNA polymerase sigma factor [Blastocatellia bacterium]|nr:sigma-70 family RNA polymerase sigma factor [Blastocatellia bacterium]
MTSEEELISRARSGDSDAFCNLARRYQRRIYSLAFHYCRDAHDAEDLSQEVWLKAFRSIKSFRGDASFYTWLRQITINSFLNYRRAAMMSGKEAAIEDAEAIDERSFDIERDMNNRLLVERVLDALGELSSQQRLVFLLKHREGMTCEEIARSLGCSTGTVKKSLFRAVMKLREHFGTDASAEPCVPTALGEGC